MRRPSAEVAVPWVVALGIAAIHATVSCVRYAHFNYTSWDLAIFTQAIHHYAHFEAPVADVHGVGFNVLGDHFSPLIAILAPLFWLWQSPVVLLLAQAAAFGLSAVPITRVARDRLGNVPGTASGIAYGLSAGLFQATRVDFHEVALAVPILAFALVALLEERWRSVAIWSVLLLFVKEDLGFTVAAIGLVLIIRGAKRLGIVLIALGFGGVLVALFAILPLLAPGHTYAYFAQYDGAHHHNSVSAVFSALSPSRLFAGFLDKWHTSLTFGWATGFLSWASPIVLIALPTLGWRFISAQSYYWGTDWHYDAVLMPIAFVAAIDTAVRWRTLGGTRAWCAQAMPAVALTVSITFASSSPIGPLFDNATWTTTPTQRAAAEALKAIPDNVVVLSDIGLMSHLAARDYVYMVGGSGDIVPDYIVTMEGAGWDPPQPWEAASYWASVYSGHEFRLVVGRDGVVLVQRIQ